MHGADPSLLRQLSENSRGYRDPLAAIDWRALAAGGFWTPEPALSLYGLPEYETLPRRTREKLAQYEYANVLCAGLWLEAVFVQRMSRRLAPALARAEYEYALHEIREEAGHSLLFLQVLERGGLALPPGAWRAPAFADFLARHATPAGALFWLATVIAEDVPDKFNRYVRGYPGELNAVTRQVSALHAVDEARHLAAARSHLERATGAMPAWKRRLLARAACALLSRYADVFYFPPAAFYELAGLTHGETWRRLARNNRVHRAFVRRQLAPTLHVLSGYGFNLGEMYN